VAFGDKLLRIIGPKDVEATEWTALRSVNSALPLVGLLLGYDDGSVKLQIHNLLVGRPHGNRPRWFRLAPWGSRGGCLVRTWRLK
jgi:hypothetical protein